MAQFANTGYVPGIGGIDWFSADWGNGWAGTPGGVARQMGLSGRAMGEFARWVNMQKRLQAEQESGDFYGYNPQYSLENMPSWIRQLYETKGASGASQATGKSGVGRYVNQAAANRSSLGIGGGSGYGGGMTPGGRARQMGLTGRDLGNYARQANRQRRQALTIQ